MRQNPGEGFINSTPTSRFSDLMRAEIHHSTRHFLSSSGVPKRKQLSNGYPQTQQDLCPVCIHGDGPRHVGD